MDALTAAASAVAMGIDENPDEDEGLGSSRATATGHENTMPVNADICADEEGDDEAPRRPRCPGNGSKGIKGHARAAQHAARAAHWSVCRPH